MTPELSKEKNPYREEFEQSERSSLDWLNDVRAAALSAFERLGLPTVADEEWKYTNPAAIAKQPFRNGKTEVDLKSVAALLPFSHEAAANRLVFVNGYFTPELSKIDTLPTGVTVGNLADETPRADAIRAHYARYAAFDREAFAALNTALARDGAFIDVARGTVVEEPIYLYFVVAHSSDFRASYPRTLILAGEASQATVVENHIALDDEGGRFGDRSCLTNCATEIVVGDAAVLEHYKLQKESLNAFHVANTAVRLKRGSVFNGHSVAFGAKLSRHNVDVVFEAEGGECNLNGLCYATGTQLADAHVSIDHRPPNCTSNLLYKGVFDDKARGVFNGKVFVRKDAQGTNARQTNRNLLLSRAARVDTKPQLEIFADDVKCGHGATVGQLSDEEIFYLLSRGLDMQTARNLLTYGFAHEVVEKLKIETIREALDKGILTRISEHVERR